MTFLLDVKKKLNNKNASIVSDGIIGDLSGFIDTGSLLLNAVVSGSVFKGIPDNKITMFAGPEAVGKSFILLTMISCFLKTYPKAYVIFFESESAQQKQNMENFGIDVSRVLFVPICTVQEFRTQALQALEIYETIPKKEREETRLFMCLDSLGNLSTSKEVEDSVSGKETMDMTRAKIIKSVFRLLSIKLGVLSVPFVCTNHIYMTQALYAQVVTGGGTGPKYNASTICLLSKRKEKDGNDKFIGNVVHCKLEKSRFTKEGSIVDILIDFSSGLDKYYGVLEAGIEAGLITQEGRKFILNTGELISKKDLLSYPEVYFNETFLTELDKYFKNKFTYGRTELEQ